MRKYQNYKFNKLNTVIELWSSFKFVNFCPDIFLFVCILFSKSISRDFTAPHFVNECKI